MTTQEIKRKLTAILSADVKGYSRLMGEDEETTLKTLSAYRDVMKKLIQQFNGRIVDISGDGLLAEFGSVVDAIRGAVEIQKELKTRNSELPEKPRARPVHAASDRPLSGWHAQGGGGVSKIGQPSFNTPFSKLPFTLPKRNHGENLT